MRRRKKAEEERVKAETELREIKKRDEKLRKAERAIRAGDEDAFMAQLEEVFRHG